MNSNNLVAGVRNVGGAMVTLRNNRDGTLQIERIEVPEDKRRQGLATAAIKALACEAEKQGIGLSAMISPDDDVVDSDDSSVIMGLRRAFSRAGFLPLAMDGEVYPADVDFMPGRAARYEVREMDSADYGCSYSGEIVEVLDGAELVIQSLGDGLCIAHNIDNLERPVVVGDQVKISYPGDYMCRAKVYDLPEMIAKADAGHLEFAKLNAEPVGETISRLASTAKSKS